MNRIRKWFLTEVDELLPILHETYRCIGLYQKSRSERAAEQLLEQLRLIGPKIAFFAQHVPGPKRPYFIAQQDQSLSLSDRLVALDIAVGAMHIEFAHERAYMHAVSRELRHALDAVRVSPDDVIPIPGSAGPADEGVLLRGIPAAPGIASGKVFIVRKKSDYKHMPADAIIVAEMTRPELLLGKNRPGAIVTDIGGSLCHAAILAREWSIPCVTGTKTATLTLRDNLWVQVNGNSGEVRAT